MPEQDDRLEELSLERAQELLRHDPDPTGALTPFDEDVARLRLVSERDGRIAAICERAGCNEDVAGAMFQRVYDTMTDGRARTVPQVVELFGPPAGQVTTVTGQVEAVLMADVAYGLEDGMAYRWLGVSDDGDGPGDDVADVGGFLGIPPETLNRMVLAEAIEALRHIPGGLPPNTLRGYLIDTDIITEQFRWEAVRDLLEQAADDPEMLVLRVEPTSGAVLYQYDEQRATAVEEIKRRTRYEMLLEDG